MHPDLRYLQDISMRLPEPYIKLCAYVLKSYDFQKAPASSGYHHAFEGGLLEHTADVVHRLERCLGGRFNWEVLLTAAIWHDFNKIHEYEAGYDEGNEYVVITKPWAKLVGHIVGGYCEFVEVATRMELPDPKIAAIGHCILSHHGRFEWGSPVEPQTDEAFLLHSADMRSVQEWKANDKARRLQQLREVCSSLQEVSNQEHSVHAVQGVPK